MSTIYASAQPATLISGGGFVFEQDVVLDWFQLPYNDDRNYTQGFGLYFFSPLLSQALDPFLGITSGSYISDLPTRISIRIAGFTPDDLQATEPVVGDRPYSSIIFLSINDQRVDQLNYRSRSWSGHFGILGIPNAAKNAQTAIHKKSNKGNTKPPYNPEGWHNQISHGGEPSLMLGYEVQHLLTTSAINSEANSNLLNNRFRGQMAWNYGFDAGYITQGSVGMNFKLGFIDLRRWPQNAAWFMNSFPVSGRPTNRELYFARQRINEFYFFLGIKGNAMLYNASLHGQFRKSEYRLNYWDTGWLYAQGRLGIGMSLGPVNFSVYGALKTPEIWNAFSRIHSWGGFSLTVGA